MEILFGALLLVLVVGFVVVPLRRQAADSATTEDPRLADLEARKEAKYREIRDAELDHAAGKLSDDDFNRQNGELRREAVEILSELDRLKERSAERPPDGPG